MRTKLTLNSEPRLPGASMRTVKTASVATRTVKTASVATPVQTVHASGARLQLLECVGSAHEEQELQTLKIMAAKPRVRSRLDEDAAAIGSQLWPIASSWAAALRDRLVAAYNALGLDPPCGRNTMLQ